VSESSLAHFAAFALVSIPHIPPAQPSCKPHLPIYSYFYSVHPHRRIEPSAQRNGGQQRGVHSNSTVAMIKSQDNVIGCWVQTVLNSLGSFLLLLPVGFDSAPGVTMPPLPAQFTVSSSSFGYPLPLITKHQSHCLLGTSYCPPATGSVTVHPPCQPCQGSPCTEIASINNWLSAGYCSVLASSLTVLCCCWA
jgi:hypothetical protein